MVIAIWTNYIRERRGYFALSFMASILKKELAAVALLAGGFELPVAWSLSP